MTTPKLRHVVDIRNVEPLSEHGVSGHATATSVTSTPNSSTSTTSQRQRHQPTSFTNSPDQPATRETTPAP